MGDFVEVPLFLPGLAIWAIIGLITARRIGVSLRIGVIHAAALVVGLGIILSATLSPQWAAFAYGATGPPTCDFSRIGFATLREYLRLGDTGGNVLMFMPLGLGLGLLPRGRQRTLLITAAAILPVAIETTQLMLGFLDRACQSGDVVDNLLGLGVGLAAGAVVGVVRGRI